MRPTITDLIVSDAHEVVLQNFCKDKYVCMHCGARGSLEDLFGDKRCTPHLELLSSGWKGVDFNMKENTLTTIEDKQEDNIIPFKKPNNKLAVITGGPTSGDENWLSNLVPGTVFLARAKLKTGQQVNPMERLILNAYLVEERKTLSSNLTWKRPDNTQINFWTPMLEFSRNMELIEVLAVLEFNVEKEDIENGNPEGTV